jgi:hypothetical protein
MAGGGIRNELLCQYTANVLARNVWAGPSEASAIGNIAVQAIALDMFWDIQSARKAIRTSFPQKNVCTGRYRSVGGGIPPLYKSDSRRRFPLKTFPVSALMRYHESNSDFYQKRKEVNGCL